MTGERDRFVGIVGGVGVERAEMLEQLRELIKWVERGEVLAYMACGVCDGDDLFGTGVCSVANFKRMHDSIIEMHETFHDCVDEAAAKESEDVGKKSH